jgi:hypothetical protein
MRPSSFYIEPFQWLYEILFLKLFVTFFSPGLMESMGEYGYIGVERFQIPLQAYLKPALIYLQPTGRTLQLPLLTNETGSHPSPPSSNP